MSYYSFKVVSLGESCVGKTSLVLRYVTDVFNSSHETTLQACNLTKHLYIDKDLVKLNIWDTAGQEKFNSLAPMYYRGSSGALLVYDVTCRQSLLRVFEWVKELNETIGVNHIQLCIIGNKIDLLVEQQTLDFHESTSNLIIEEAIQFTEELPNAKHYVTSAKNNTGVGAMFASLSRRIIEQNERLAANANGLARPLEGSPNSKSGWPPQHSRSSSNSQPTSRPSFCGNLC